HQVPTLSVAPRCPSPALAMPHVLQLPSASSRFALSLHDALPISLLIRLPSGLILVKARKSSARPLALACKSTVVPFSRLDTTPRSEEHTSELQSRENLVCRLLLEKKQKHPCPQSAKRYHAHHRGS